MLSCNSTDTLSKGQTQIRILINENEIFVENNELPISKETLHPSNRVQSKLTHSIFKSFNIETTYLVFFWSRVVDVCEIKTDKYRPCDSMSPFLLPPKSDSLRHRNTRFPWVLTKVLFSYDFTELLSGEMVRMPDSVTVFWGFETYMMHFFIIIIIFYLFFFFFCNIFFFCIKLFVPYFLILDFVYTFKAKFNASRSVVLSVTI